MISPKFHSPGRSITFDSLLDTKRKQAGLALALCCYFVFPHGMVGPACKRTLRSRKGRNVVLSEAPQNKLHKSSKSGVAPVFENSQDCCPSEYDSPKAATEDQNLISAIAVATKAVWSNRLKREIHTQPITGLSALCSHTVFSYSPVLVVSKQHNTPKREKHSRTPGWKATLTQRSDVATSPALSSSGQGFPKWAGGNPF